MWPDLVCHYNTVIKVTRANQKNTTHNVRFLKAQTSINVFLVTKSPIEEPVDFYSYSGQTFWRNLTFFRAQKTVIKRLNIRILWCLNSHR